METWLQFQTEKKPGWSFSYSIFILSGGCVDTEQCKSTCLQCRLTKSMCHLEELFEVQRKLPTQTSEGNAAQALKKQLSSHCRDGWTLFRLQALSCFTPEQIHCFVTLPPSFFFGVCGFFNILGTSCLCV